MHRTLSRKSLATMYALGLIWIVAMLGGALVLVQPMMALYEAIELDDPVFRTVATMSLVVLLATSVTIGVALALRSTSTGATAAERA